MARSTSIDDPGVLPEQVASTTSQISQIVVLLRFGFVELRSVNPPLIFTTAVLPRIIFQTLFWTLLGRVAGGAAGERYAFIGAVVVSLTLQTVAQMTDPPITDKWSGTYGRLLGAAVPPAIIYLCRGVASWTFALLEMSVCWIVVGLVTGNARTAIDMIPSLPAVLLVSVTMACSGYLCAAFCVGKRAEVAIYNLLTYMIIVCSNALVPRGKVAALDTIGTILPGSHGLTVIRAITDRQPWNPSALLAELIVGICWLSAGIALHQHMARRSRATGAEAFS